MHREVVRPQWQRDPLDELYNKRLPPGYPLMRLSETGAQCQKILFGQKASQIIADRQARLEYAPRGGGTQAAKMRGACPVYRGVRGSLRGVLHRSLPNGWYGD